MTPPAYVCTYKTLFIFPLRHTIETLPKAAFALKTPVFGRHLYNEHSLMLAPGKI
jgi:hypothetical protein